MIRSVDRYAAKIKDLQEMVLETVNGINAVSIIIQTWEIQMYFIKSNWILIWACKNKYFAIFEWGILFLW